MSHRKSLKLNNMFCTNCKFLTYDSQENFGLPKEKIINCQIRDSSKIFSLLGNVSTSINGNIAIDEKYDVNQFVWLPVKKLRRSFIHDKDEEVESFVRDFLQTGCVCRNENKKLQIKKDMNKGENYVEKFVLH